MLEGSGMGLWLWASNWKRLVQVVCQQDREPARQGQVSVFAFFQIHGHDEYFKKEKKKAHPGIKGNVQS